MSISSYSSLLNEKLINIKDIIISPNSEFFIFINKKKELLVWDNRACAFIQHLLPFHARISQLKFSQDNKFIVYSIKNKKITLDSKIFILSIKQLDQYLNNNQQIQNDIFNQENQNLIQGFRQVTSEVDIFNFSEDSRELIIITEDYNIYIYNCQLQQLIKKYQYEESIVDVIFNNRQLIMLTQTSINIIQRCNYRLNYNIMNSTGFNFNMIKPIKYMKGLIFLFSYKRVDMKCQYNKKLIRKILTNPYHKVSHFNESNYELLLLAKNNQIIRVDVRTCTQKPIKQQIESPNFYKIKMNSEFIMLLKNDKLQIAKI